MKQSIAACLVTLIGIATGAPSALAQSPASAKLQCLELAITTSRLPTQLPVGVVTVHRDPEKIITEFVPLAPEGRASRMLDTNAKNSPTSHLFVVSDGTIRTSFVSVDETPGSRLDHCLAELQGKIGGGGAEAAYLYLRDHLGADLLHTPPPNYVFPWDQGHPGQSDELLSLYHEARDMPVGHSPARSHQLQKVVPLEEFLRLGYGTCVQKALLASALLTRLGLSHRLVNGSSEHEGHVWIQLKDGRILDPSYNKLEQPKPTKDRPGWLTYGTQTVFEEQTWPYLALD